METTAVESILSIAGVEELTAVNADRFRRLIDVALDGHTVVEVDLSQTAVMDCGGLGALITVRNQLRGRGGHVRLIGATPAVQRLFDVLRVGDLFEIVQGSGPEKSRS